MSCSWGFSFFLSQDRCPLLECGFSWEEEKSRRFVHVLCFLSYVRAVRLVPRNFEVGFPQKMAEYCPNSFFFPGREKGSQGPVIDTPTHLKNNYGAKHTEKKAW